MKLSQIEQANQLVSQFPGGGFVASDGVDSYAGAPDPATGLRTPVPVGGPPTADGFPSAWHRQRYVSDLKRELDGVEHRLVHLEGPVLAWQEPPTRESLERQRASLEGTRSAILAELERLEPEPPKEAKQHGRSQASAERP